MRSLILTFLILTAGCASRPKLTPPQRFTSAACQARFTDVAFKETLKKLDALSDLYSQECFHEAIKLGTFIRSHHREKFYSVISEIGELATPEGTLTEYVLESYERSYLSLLLAMSYLKINMKEAALVELRHSVMDEEARIYNYGSDPVITLLQAVLWSNLDPVVSRPFWKKLSEDDSVAQAIIRFSKDRIQDLDSGKPTKGWHLYGLGYLPPLNWKTDFLSRKKGPYQIQTTRVLPTACSTEDALLIPTDSWINKISRRYESEYHPLVYTKSLLRVPFGLTYGLMGVTTGVAAGIAGCGAASYVHSGDLCDASLRGAAFIINKTGDLVSYTLAPDLRRWDRIPAAFYVTRENRTQPFGACYQRRNVAPLPIQILQK